MLPTTRRNDNIITNIVINILLVVVSAFTTLVFVSDFI